MTGDRNNRFHERFQIDVNADEIKLRFVNRCFTYIFDHVSDTLDYRSTFGSDLYSIHSYIALALGERFNYQQNFHDWIPGGDFWRCLQVLEALYHSLPENDPYSETGANDVSERIRTVLSFNEIDIGVRWQPPIFVPSGAQLLDERLINESLRWLSEQKYKTVYDPFEKALKHFVESEKKPHLLADVITDMYEALEALAKIATGRANKDLSANRDKFISAVGASEHYKKLLKEYISYANEFRHAAREPGAKPVPSEAEVESFIYLTGLFMRLAIQRT